MKTIGVVLGATGAVDVLENGSEIAVYEKTDGIWVPKESIPIEVDAWTSLSSVRASVQKIIDALGVCKIIAAQDISGVAYQIFNRNGFYIFQIDALNDQILEWILSEIQQEKEASEAKLSVPTAPIPEDQEGRYFMDLILLQKTYPEMSSKKALKPFLETAHFYELKLICSHIPPWIEHLRGVNYSTKVLGEQKIEMIIKKKVCGSC